MTSLRIHLGCGPALAICCLVVSTVRADGPTLRRMMPPGAERGTSVEVTTLGDAPNWPVQIWSDHSGIHWEALKEKGKFRVTVEPTVPIGTHHVRFFDSDNATDAMPFAVGRNEESLEKEPNDRLKDAQVAAKSPQLFNGLLEKRGDVDTYAVDLKEGEHLIADIDAQQVLRSPLDASLQVLSDRGVVLAQNLDAHGLDPWLDFVAPRDGRYFVRVFGFPETPDSTISFAGGETMCYRLAVARGGWLLAVRPMAVSSLFETKLELAGLGIPAGIDSYTVPVIPASSSGMQAPYPLVIDGVANTLYLPVLAMPLVNEQPAADNLQTVTLPTSLTGVLDRPAQIDRFRFEAKKESKLRFALHSRDLGSSMDGVLRILDEAGKQLAREDDTQKIADPTLTWQPPTAGHFVLEVSDAFGAGGDAWRYRVDIEPVVADVRLLVKTDHYQGKIGQPVEMIVTVERRDGFDQELQIAVEGLPDFVVCPVVVSEKMGPSAKEVRLMLTSSAAIQNPFRIVAKASAIQRTAVTSADALVSDLWLTIK